LFLLMDLAGQSSVGNHVTVYDELCASVGRLIESNTPQDQIKGSHIAILMNSILIEFIEFMERGSAEENDFYHSHKDKLIMLARSDQPTRVEALKLGLISLSQALEMEGGLAVLMSNQSISIAYVTYAGFLLEETLPFLQLNSPYGESGVERAKKSLTAFGNYLIQNAETPWMHGRVTPWESEKSRILRSSGQEAEQSLNGYQLSSDAIAYLGGAATLLMIFESSELRSITEMMDDPSMLGQFSDLYPYIESRVNGISYDQELPTLPVPIGFQRLFLDWAARRVDFIAGELCELSNRSVQDQRKTIAR
jgi:hypothetical protein